MSTVVQDIFTNLKSQAATTLGANFQVLRRVFDPSQNDLRASYQGYAIRHGSAINAAGVTRFYTLDQTFELVLMNTTAVRNDDADIQTTINGLYDKADEYLKDIITTKIGLPTTVLNIESLGITTPEILENGSVIIIVSFVVKYRRQLDL